MSENQIAAAVAMAVVGLLLIVISASARDSFGGLSPFADHLSKAGIFLGAAMLLPLVLGLLVGVIVGFR